MKCLLGTLNVIAGNSKGDIYMMFLQQKEPTLQVNIHRICDTMVDYSVNSIETAPFDALSTFAVAAHSGREAKMQVWNRKSFNRRHNPAEELTRIYELEYYLIDSCVIG